MRPVLFDLGGVELQSYGLSKALAALVAGWLLQRELVRIGRSPAAGYPLAIAATVGGFLGAKLYYLVEVSGDGITLHDLGGSGFTWYGGLVGGAIAALLVAHRRGLAPRITAGIAPIPLLVAYGIGRLGCLLAGDGTYGTPTDLPWGMSFPQGTVPTLDRVHPAPLYEALAAFVIAVLLRRLRDRLTPVALFGTFLTLFGAERLLVELVRLNDTLVLGLTAAQVWSLGLIAFGIVLLAREWAHEQDGRPLRGNAAMYDAA